MSDYLLILRIVIVLAVAAFGIGSMWLMCLRTWRRNDRRRSLPPAWQDD